ncbi:helix-turn-helix domain-containing protein [Streptomyces sp. NPDC005438]|uniref:TetR/AcrR family transcriptional regulator n=1 Tax=Streptomyces sp. NPDC005438 TaxID=3156880 RepID=UPI0033A3A6BF
MNGAGGGRPAPGAPGRPRATPLRVDAQRNLEHVLRAAREVFGELGYGAPMEDVARRARVGVGTVYRRFPSKDVLVQRIAQEETARLTEQARSALEQEGDAWAALSRFLRTSVASGAGRLLPPRVLRVGEAEVPVEGAGRPQPVSRTEPSAAPVAPAVGGVAVPSAVGQPDQATGVVGVGEPDGSPEELLSVVGQLVERARATGALRSDVTVSDVLLVIATAAPSLPDAAQQTAVANRLLDILLEGLRPHGPQAR